MLIDKLLFMFEADTKDLKKGVDEGTDSAEELKDAMEKAEEQGKKTSENFKSFAKGALGLIAAAKTASTAITGAMREVGETEQIARLSEMIGASVEDTDALSKSIISMGGSFDAASGDIQTMAAAMEKRGIAPMEGILELADQLKEMDLKKATAKMKLIGITDRHTIDLLRKGRVELDAIMKAQKSSGVVTKDAVEKAAKFREAMLKMKLALGDATGGLTKILIPALTKTLEALTKGAKWVKEHQTFVVAFFAAVAAVVMATYVPAMIAAAAATLAATWPLLLIIAVVVLVAAAIALLVDDIHNFIDGNDSLLGNIMEKYPKIAEFLTNAMDAIKNAFEHVVDAIDWLWEKLKSFGVAVREIAKNMWEQIKKYFGYIVDIIETVSKKLDAAAGWVAKKIGIATEEKVTREVVDKYEPDDDMQDFSGVKFERDGGILAGIDESFYKEFGKGEEQRPRTAEAPRGEEQRPRTAGAPRHKNARGYLTALTKNIDVAKVHVESAKKHPANAATSTVISNQKTTQTQKTENNTTIGQITVETQATDSKGISIDLRESLFEQMQKMQAGGASAITR